MIKPSAPKECSPYVHIRNQHLDPKTPSHNMNGLKVLQANITSLSDWLITQRKYHIIGIQEHKLMGDKYFKKRQMLLKYYYVSGPKQK